jgi:hypothetical protein
MKMSVSLLPIHWPRAVHAFFAETRNFKFLIQTQKAQIFKIDRVETQQLYFLNNISID